MHVDVDYSCKAPKTRSEAEEICVEREDDLLGFSGNIHEVAVLQPGSSHFRREPDLETSSLQKIAQAMRNILIKKEAGQDLGFQGLDLVVRYGLVDAFRET